METVADNTHTSITCFENIIAKVGLSYIHFGFISYHQVINGITKLNSEKLRMPVTCQSKLLKKSKDPFAYFIHHNFTNSFLSSVFPTGLKWGNVRSTHKKDDKTDKAICWFISECIRLVYL